MASDIVERFRRQFEYDHWANREVLASLKAAVHPLPRSLRFLAHIIAAEWLWHGRLTNDTQVVEVWPHLALDQ